MEVPITFVGNMPRLLASSGWTFQIIDTSEIRACDLVFLKRRAEPKLVAHAVLVLALDKVFHCKKNCGMKVEPLEGVFEEYEQKLLQDQLRYIDSRDKTLRAVHGGWFIEN